MASESPTLPGTFLQKAIDLVTKATEEDRKKNYEKALQLYEEGFQNFLHAIMYEAQGDKLKEAIRAKSFLYLERAEQINKFLKKQKKKKSYWSLGCIKYRKISLLNRSKAGASSDDDDDEEADKKKLRAKLETAILVEKPKVDWNDVAGLEAAKAALNHIIIIPMQFPHLFTGNRVPWKAILLFGLTGTGKSYLAKAVATAARNATFFSLSSADLVGKWLGEGEKRVRNLFELARERKPSIIFIDEIDTLCAVSQEKDSEAMKRIKAEFLIEMQGVGTNSEGVIVLGATKIPWVLDTGIIRRFEKRIYLPLPGEEARVAMFKIHLGDTRTELTEADMKELGRRTVGYSGSDISMVVKEAMNRPVLKIQTATHFKKIRGPSPKDPEVIVDDLMIPCSPGDPGAIVMSWMEIEKDQLAEPPVSLSDMLRSLATSRPTIHNEDWVKLEKFKNDYGHDDGGHTDALTMESVTQSLLIF